MEIRSFIKIRGNQYFKRNNNSYIQSFEKKNNLDIYAFGKVKKVIRTANAYKSNEEV